MEGVLGFVRDLIYLYSDDIFKDHSYFYEKVGIIILVSHAVWNENQIMRPFECKVDCLNEMLSLA